ncbi:MAG: hypothetical protein P8076_13355 [Gammaproteobacteria bacterium]
MQRRLYFLFPSRSQANRVIEELRQAGIDPSRLHTVAWDRHTRERSRRSLRQTLRDREHQLERWIWNGNLLLFFCALALLLLFAYNDATGWALVMLALMTASFVAGLLATVLPNAHLDNFVEALNHGDVLLMVDVPKRQVSQIGQRVHHHHPEASVGGVGWTVGRI